MEDLIKKISHQIPEVSDRAVKSLASKLSNRICSVSDLVSIENGVIAGSLLYWINERQTKADVHTLAAALNMLTEVAAVPVGHRALCDIGAVEFLSAYFNHVPTSLQSKISVILNSLVSTSFKPIHSNKVDLALELPVSPVKPQNEFKRPVEKTMVPAVSISAHSEFPPVMLCESDEKVLFDLGVTIKFGNIEEMLECIEQIENRVFRDFPIDCLLQRHDLISSTVLLAKSAVQKKNVYVGLKALRVMESFLQNIQSFAKELGKAEYRPPSIVTKKSIARPEYLEISHPCLDTVKWETGTPGQTLSLLGAVEMIMLGIPLNEVSLLGQAIQTWRAGLWALPKLMKYPSIICKVFSGVTSAYQYHVEISNTLELPEGKIYLKALLDLSVKVIFMLKPEEVSSILKENTALVTYLANSIVFQGEYCDGLLPYIQAVDPQLIREYEHARKTKEGIAASKKISQMLSLERVLPIANPGLFYKAIDFFSSVLPCVEFEPDAPIPSAVIDINIYSVIISQDSNLDAKTEECRNLLMSLLACPLEHIRKNTIEAMGSALGDDTPLEGVGNGYIRSEIASRVFISEPILGELIINHSAELLPNIISNNEDYQAILKYFTVIQALAPGKSALAGIVLRLTNLAPQSQPLRFVRDLFSVDPSYRAIAGNVLRSTKSPESIQKAWSSSQEIVWGMSDSPDPLQDLTKEGEIETIELLDYSEVTESEVLTMVNIMKSKSLETNLKLASSEQLLNHLLTGRPAEKSIEEIIEIAVSVLTESHGDDRVTRKFVAKALEILVVCALNYPSRSRKVYQGSVKFICSVVPYAFHEYYEVKYYSMYLLYILAFSHTVERNSFVPGDGYSLVLQPTGHNGRLAVCPVVGLISRAFPAPFPVQTLAVDYAGSSGFLSHWEMTPSSDRVKDYLFAVPPSETDSDFLLDKWTRELHAAETHNDIVQIIGEWCNLTVVSAEVSKKLYLSLMYAESGIFPGVLSLLRTVPTNKTEDLLYIKILEYISIILPLTEPALNPAEYDFIYNISQLFQRNIVPFLVQLSNIEVREPLVLKILQTLRTLLKFQGTPHPTEESQIKVLSRFQLEPGEASFLSLLQRTVESSSNFSLYQEVALTLSTIFGVPQLNVPLDLHSPLSSSQLTSILDLLIAKLLPFNTASTFVNRGVLKDSLKLFLRAKNYLHCETFMWLIRLTEHRDASIRILSWTLIMSLPVTIYTAHSSVLNSALDVVFAQKECFGVRTRACGFLWTLLQSVIDAELGTDPSEVLAALNSYGTISHIKNLLFEANGVPGSFLGGLARVLYNMSVLDPAHVSPVCIQLDIWDPLIRLIRPNSMLERMCNEPRVPCKEFSSECVSDCVVGLIELLRVTCLMMNNNSQLTDYLLEGTHLLGYCVEWLCKISSAYNESNERVYAAGVMQLADCIHIAAYQLPGKAKQALEHFSYSVLADIMDRTRATDVKLALGRLLTAVLPILPIEEAADRLVLSLVSLSKSTENDLVSQQEAVFSLSCLLLYSEEAKRVAVTTGFPLFLYEQGLGFLKSLESIDLSKQKQPDEGVLRQISNLLVILKFWSSNSPFSKQRLSLKSASSCSEPLLFLFKLWPLSLKREKLLKLLLETLCTLVSGSDEGKKSLSLPQDSRQSILSHVLAYVSRPTTASDSNFSLALQLLGTLSTCKEGLGILIKSKYPQGLATRLVTQWNENKDPTVVPLKCPSILQFLSTFSFFTEGQKTLGTVKGLIEVLTEILERYSAHGLKHDLAGTTLLLLRNLCFTNKPHILASPKALSLLLSFTSAPAQKPALRLLASSALWALLYNNQKVKGILARPAVASELTSVLKELSRDVDKLQLADCEERALYQTARDNVNSILRICTNP